MERDVEMGWDEKKHGKVSNNDNDIDFTIVRNLVDMPDDGIVQLRGLNYR